MASHALAEIVRLQAAYHGAVAATTPDVVAEVVRADRPAVEGMEGTLVAALLTVGGLDAAALAPLAPAAADQVARLDAADPDGVQPHLSVLSVVNLLQVMGVDVPAGALATGRAWLAGMETAGIEPEAWHWQRGLAALALGDAATARTIAALPESGPTGVDPAADPGLNVQAWFALLVAAVEDGIAWADLRGRWEQLLDHLPAFVEVDVLAEADVAWTGRILHHQVAGAPLGEVADWIHAEVHRVAGVEPAPEP